MIDAPPPNPYVIDQLRTIVDLVQLDPDEATRMLNTLMAEYGSSVVVAALIEISATSVAAVRHEIALALHRPALDDIRAKPRKRPPEAD